MSRRSMTLLPRIVFLLVLAVDFAIPDNGADDICTLGATWKEAYRCCRSHSLVLPAPNNMTEVSRLFHQIGNQNVTSAWLLYIRSVRRDWMWIDGDIADSGTIDERRPGFCGAYNQSTRRIEARACGDKTVVGAICEIKDCEACETLTRVSIVCIWYNNTCYIYFCNKHNWYQAKKNCVRPGWTMATVKRNVLRGVLASREWACDIFWIGVRKDDWLYPANKGFNGDVYNIWPRGGPAGSGRCVVLNASGAGPLVHPVSCSEKHAALCEDDQAGHKRLMDKERTPSFLEGMLGGLALLIIVLVGTVTVFIFRHKRRKNKKESTTVERGRGEETYPLREHTSEHECSEQQVASYAEPTKLVRPWQSERKNPDQRQAACLLDNLSRHTDLDYKNLCKKVEKTGQGHLEKLSCIKDENTTHITQIYGDELIRLRKRIATHYKRTKGRIPRWPYGQGQHDIDIDELYVSGRCLNMQTKQIIEDNDKIFYKKKEKLVFIQGRPGSGKTTFINRSLTFWAKGVLEVGTEDTATIGEEQYAIMLLISLRDVKCGATFTDVIREQMYWQHSEDVDRVSNFLEENPEDVILVLDGLDEYEPSTSPAITSIIEGEKYPDVSRVVTSRHTQAGSKADKLVKNYTTFLEIQGFKTEQITSYIRKYFAKSNGGFRFYMTSAEPEVLEECADSLHKEIEEKKLLSLCSVPLHMNLVCILWEAGRGLGRTKTELYIRVLKFTLDIHKAKRNPPPVADLQDLTQDHEIILSCGILALMSLMGVINRFTFTTGKGRSHKEETLRKAYELGLMITTVPVEFESYNKLTFSHLSLQELLAAYAVVHSVEHLNKFLAHLNNVILIHDFRNVIIFISGLSESCGNLVLNHCINVLNEGTEFPTIFQCPYFNPMVWDGEENFVPELSDPSNDISYLVHLCLLERKHRDLLDITLPAYITLNIGTEQADNLLSICDHAKSQQRVKALQITGDMFSSKHFLRIFPVLEIEHISFFNLSCEAVEDVGLLADFINKMTGLRKIHVKMDCESEEEGKRLLRAVSQRRNVRELVLHHLNIENSLEMLISYLKQLQSLVLLSIENIDLSGAGCECRWLVTNSSLSALYLKSAYLTIYQIRLICAVLPSSCPCLLCLELEDNDISGAEEYIGKAVSGLARLTALSLGEDNMQTFYHIMQNLPESLLTLSMCDNPTKDVSYLKNNPSLLKNIQILSLVDTDIPESDMHDLVKVCKSYNHNLRVIYEVGSGLELRELAAFYAKIKRKIGVSYI